MFTGIVTHIGTVVRIEDHRGDKRIFIRSKLPLSEMKMGGSVSCAGVCLTVVEIMGDVLAADVSAETLSKTTLGSWEEGTRINLEASLKVGDEMGGHIVSGHVDGICRIESIKIEGDSHRLKVSAPRELAHYVAPKGSVTLDGISLTVNEVDGAIFGVNIIPHTWIHTTLGDRSEGDVLNLEIDVLARYVGRMMEMQNFKGLTA